MTRLLSIDPGAERCGWAIIDQINKDLKRIDSGIWRVPRNENEPFQDYRLRLTRQWVVKATYLIKRRPDVLISEIVPFRGGNPGAMAQMYLAATVVTVLQTLAFSAKIQVNQISANTVKTKIGGKKDASKVRVRNGVYHFLPETKLLNQHNWSKVFDESDAHAIGLAYLGYDIRNRS